MIEVVLLCNLLAPVLNIPHLGCVRLQTQLTRPSQMSGLTPVYLGHTVTIIVCYNKGPVSLCVTFLCQLVLITITGCMGETGASFHSEIYSLKA